MKMMPRLLFAFFLLYIFGCASVPPAGMKTQGVPGIYLRVEKGQTLWSISKLYGLDLDELVRVNNLSGNSRIQAGQTL
ncbi:MAG: LysM domain-containing protein, partial [Candidatus Omnitrophica bacterium]|nr:LysM domain-containing protein [Candidatus Omnitrophota bacterium]